MAAAGAKPWSAVLPAALFVLAVILITAKADDYTAASTTGSGPGLPSHCKLPSGCDKVLSSTCNDPLFYGLSFCGSQRAKANDECCRALLEMGAQHECASCDLLEPFEKVRSFDPKECDNDAGKHIKANYS